MFDPSCGTGEFLVRAYSRLKYLSSASAQSITNRLWGIDADETAVNEARRRIRETSKTDSLGSLLDHIICGDFFDLPYPQEMKQSQLTLKECESGEPVERLKGTNAVHRVPTVDAVVGNPPYTRQEELASLPFKRDYKDKILEALSRDFPEDRFPKTMGVHGYFIVHATRFLASTRSRLGFVTLRSWMDSRYGSALRDFVLRHFRVLAVIASTGERWFSDAQMIPCVVILELCDNVVDRDNNVVKFIHFKNLLEDYVPVGQENEAAYWSRVDDFVDQLEHAEKNFEFDEVEFIGTRLGIHEENSIKIVILKQQFLKSDNKWSKFLIAPKLFFEVVNRSQKMTVPLSNIAVVRRGITTGANDFFLFPNRFFSIESSSDGIFLIDKNTGKRRFFIEQEYLRPVLRTVRGHRSIRILTPDGFILSVKDSKERLGYLKRKVLEYIEYGEKMKVRLRRGLRQFGEYANGYHQLATVQARRTWYSLATGEPAPIVFPNIFWSKHVVYLNEIGGTPTNVFFEIHPRKGIDAKLLCAILNSTLTAILAELSGRYIENRDRTLSNQLMIYELKRLPIVHPEKLGPLKQQLEKSFDANLDIDIPSTISRGTDSFLVSVDKITLCDLLRFSGVEMMLIRKNLSSVVKERLKLSGIVNQKD